MWCKVYTRRMKSFIAFDAERPELWDPIFERQLNYETAVFIVSFSASEVLFTTMIIKSLVTGFRDTFYSPKLQKDSQFKVVVLWDTTLLLQDKSTRPDTTQPNTKSRTYKPLSLILLSNRISSITSAPS